MENTEGENQKFLRMTTAPVPGLICRLAVPTIVSMLITAVYNMADTYFVGGLGISAQGAVGVVFSLMAIIQAIGFTFGNGAGNTISRLLGQKENERAEEVASTGFFYSIAAGLLLTVLGLIFIDPLVRSLGATDTILPYARDYARFILLGAPYMVGSLVLNNLLRFQGSAVYGMVGIAAGAVLNIILDPIFIFVLDLGTGGAALATIISQLVGFLILLVNCGRGGNIPLRISRFRWRWSTVGPVLTNGMPSFYRQGLASVASILLNLAAKPYGDVVIAAMTIVNRVTMFAGSALVGFGQGFQPVCGYNYGAALYHRVREGFWFCVKTAFVVLLCVTALAEFFAPAIVALFQKSDPEVILVGARALRFQMLALPLTAYVILNNMLMQTAGESLKASVLAMARQGLFFIPLIKLLPMALGLTGVVIAQPISDVATFLLSIPLSVAFFRKMRRLERGTL